MHPSWAEPGRIQLVLPTPLKFTHHEEKVLKAIIWERRLGRVLTAEEVDAIDEDFENDKRTMRDWIQFQLGSRSGMNKHIQ